MNINPHHKYHQNKISKTVDRFRQDILLDLGSNPKKLSSKYFYDKIGDELFQKIMNMESYYLTNCELDIFKTKTAQIADFIRPNNEPFDLIELGAGDAIKSSYLLQYLVDQGATFSFMPIDISGNILSVLKNKLNNSIPNLEIICLKGEYFEMIDQATTLSSRRKVVLFLGSNIGNMEYEQALQFCSELKNKLSAGDYLLIGFDLKKHPKTILQAYDDRTGITASFNLNLLKRINQELDADFDISQFEHYQTYDPSTGACRSYLISLINQQVTIGEYQIPFYENEAIFMEISQKFSSEDIHDLARESGFVTVTELYDTKKWFMDAIWKVS
ncbi:L-histidine N(alpha)-methyltransferase [Sphingobacterium faecium]|uniref:L-histidine N(alpha)-methyltransferase n=1 Tax=Sphingobacterium faecium TaxID=34087 RepID=UPI002469B691|nr:L-histidine N(alpha)-methyltransferase [Sphingobacterium faecium]MDH5825994.1 L-histidine N(alpha)-methyltransferase [Sphingobacterium faecium]